ncbi:hypothetical protein CC2G_007867 [Coprinopsis cinerea AmutBmut pab1-1]|nr:hypothetical protein CC2G_007867 [Coprinopsis cinerea AmutBmut pab1-1]
MAYFTQLKLQPQQPEFTVTPESGLVVTEEMKTILAQPGFLNRKNGGERLRYLFPNQSLGFNVSHLSLFAAACFFGNFERVKKEVEEGKAPNLSSVETEFQQGYASYVILGSQRTTNTKTGGIPIEHLKVLKYLIPHGLALDVPDIAGYTALHHSVLANTGKEREQLIRALLEGGANINAQNRWGETPLMCAMATQDTLGVEILIEAGADLDIKNGDDESARTWYPLCGPVISSLAERLINARSGEKAPLAEKKCDQCSTKKDLKRCVPVPNCLVLFQGLPTGGLEPSQARMSANGQQHLCQRSSTHQNSRVGPNR